MDNVVQLELFPKFSVVQGWADKANWSLVPQHMRHGIELWVNHGIRPGDFMESVLKNNLRAAVLHADEVNFRRLSDIVMFLFDNVPAGCWGSPEKVRLWKGLCNG